MDHRFDMGANMDRTSRRKTASFFLGAFGMDLAASTALTALPYMAISLGAASLALGFLGAAPSVAYGLVVAVTGIASDRAGRRIFILIGIIGAAIAAFFLGSCSALWQLFFVSFALTAAIGFFWPAWFGLAGDEHSPEELGRGTVAVNFGWSTGGAIGAVIAGILFEIRPALPFIAAAFAALLVLPVYLMRPSHAAFRPEAQGRRVVSERPRPSIREESASIVGETHMWRLWLGNLSVFSMIGLLVCVFPALGHDIGVTAGVFGAFVFLLGAMRSGAFLVGLRWGAWLRDWRVSVLSQLAAAAMLATISAATSHVWLACVFATAGLAAGVTYFSGSYASLSSARGRGMRSGLLEVSVVAGMLTGSLGGGLIADLAGKRGPYVPVACVAGLLVIIQATLSFAPRGEPSG